MLGGHVAVTNNPQNLSDFNHNLLLSPHVRVGGRVASCG